MLRTRDSSVSALVEIENGFVVGTENGTIEVYNPNLELQNTLSEHGEIVEMFTQGGVVHVISDDSYFYLFDPSSCEYIKNIHFGTSSVITSFSHHPLLPDLFAYGSSDQSIKLCEKQAEDLVKLQSIRYHDGFLGQRLGNINKVTWHPQRMVLGTVTSETFLSIYGMNNKPES
jgi:regulator-associated protein of mTOR